MTREEMPALLEVKNLHTQFRTDDGLVKAVDDVSFKIGEREIVGVVGESGCGKSVTQLSVMRLIRPPGKITQGEIIFEGDDLTKYEANGPEMRSVRGGKIAMIFQEPMTSLNPVLTIGRQLTEMPELHLKMNKSAAKRRAVELLDMVGIPNADTRLGDYPHQFSGGMRQRAMIAMALSCNPRIVIADEPTTALDVTTQAQLLELMVAAVEEFNSSLVIVTHNLGVVARYAQKIYIMYAGRIVESGRCKEIFAHPRHPYTIGLLRCVPRIDEGEGRKLEAIPGLPPNLSRMTGKCAFLPRCTYASDRCKTDPWPELDAVGDGHCTRCYVNPGETS
jgi:oligopeptide/dipeptide ABC transporter ATP-binding protein